LEDRREWVEPEHGILSIARQCALAGVSRSSYYYERLGTESEENLALMKVIDGLYLERPFYGAPWMTDWLRERGYAVNHKRVERLMRVMGLQATLPGPHTSRPHPEHRVSLYVLRDVEIKRPNQVWCADMTSVPMTAG
jgi:putative transposase